MHLYDVLGPLIPNAWLLRLSGGQWPQEQVTHYTGQLTLGHMNLGQLTLGQLTL